MKQLNLDTLSEETAREVITILDLVSGIGQDTVVLRGERALYQLSKIQPTEENDEFTAEVKHNPDESFSDTNHE